MIAVYITSSLFDNPLLVLNLNVDPTKPSIVNSCTDGPEF